MSTQDLVPGFADLLPEQKANLLTLAKFLYEMPLDYERRFNMGFYTGALGNGWGLHDVAEDKTVACGTAGCAVGRGPAAGIAALPKETWYHYEDRVFGLSEYAWAWCFSSDWAPIDNTPQGAAKRILLFILGRALPVHVAELGFALQSNYLTEFTPTEADWKEAERLCTGKTC